MLATPTGKWWRVGGAAGIIFSVGFVVLYGVVIANAPMFDDPIGEIREFYADDATKVLFFTWAVSLLMVFAFLPFAVALRSLLRSEDDSGGVWSRLSFVGAVLTVALGGAGTAFATSLALGNIEELSDGLVRTLVQMDGIAYGFGMGWGVALFVAAASVVVLRSGVLWRWLGWLGLASALLLVVGALWIIDGDSDSVFAILNLSGLLVAIVWMLAAGIAMVRRESLDVAAR